MIDQLQENLIEPKLIEDSKIMEKGSIELKGKEGKENLFNEDEREMKEIDIFDPNVRKQFDYDTLNRDLADIEERLRQTRLSWNKNSRTSNLEISEMVATKDSNRRSWSMLDIDRKTYSSASSNCELDKYDGEKVECESPAMSDGLLKWDYGADIGLNQDDSDEMEPITWPVTAEEAQRNEKEVNNRRMKQSLSQGSFLASPDPEDKHNLINKVAEEYKSRKSSSSQNLSNNQREYTSVSTIAVGKYDDVSARQIMEQAEAAEKRLRERLEVVKAIHLNGRTDKAKESVVTAETTNVAHSPLVDEFIPESNKSNAAEDESRSPTSISNTGRTTTIESTHSFSDYGKAPVFQLDAYGTRADYGSIESSGGMYAKRNKDKSAERSRTICGIAPELDTISSRETLHISEEKKENSLFQDEDSGVHASIKENPVKEPQTGLQEDNLQVKWDRFKMIRKDEEHEQLFDKTTLRSAAQYNPQNSHRQYSSATTFTTITNVSPRYDSFATETFKSPLRDNMYKDNAPDNCDTTGEQRAKKSSTKISPTAEEKNGDNRRSEIRQTVNGRSRRILGGAGGKKDDDDDDDDISQTEKRRIRHAGSLKKLKKKFGSGQMDGETTASELEHDDVVKGRQSFKDRGGRCEQLSQMLTELSRRGAAQETAMDVSAHSDSTSVDTMQLMNRMSKLLGKQTKDTGRKNESNSQSKERVSRRPLTDSTRCQNKRLTDRTNCNKIAGSEDGMLVLKHLMLKQKVKWLADCAREEARRRKVKKLQKLIDMYDQGDRVVIPSDLETDTATLMGSERGSQDDLLSQSDSCSQYDELTPINVRPPYQSDQKPPPTKTRPKTRSLRQEYYESRQQQEEKKIRSEYKNTEVKKRFPPSETWHVPLRDDRSNQPDANVSNWHDGISPIKVIGKPPQRYMSPCSRAESFQEKPVNLSAKERVRIKYELEMARQRNAHECQKDIRHSKTGDTKVAGSGLSWTVGSSYNDQDRNGKRRSDSYGMENDKEKGNTKSDLQVAFEKKMEGFISRSRQRQKRIKLASDERRYESQMNVERARLFVNSSSLTGVPKRRPSTQPDPLSVTRVKDRDCPMSSHRSVRVPRSTAENLYKPRRRKVSKREMKIQSARRYQTLPEVQAKYVDERKKARMQNNRMRMQLYGERILQTVLRNRGPWVSDAR